MAKGKGLNMQKKPKLAVLEYSGAGWYGEVYEVAPNWWAWAAGVELADRGVFEGGVGYKDQRTAYDAMALAVMAAQRKLGVTVLNILANS